MGRRSALLTAALVAVSFVATNVAPATAAGAKGCDSLAIAAGDCPQVSGSIVDGGVQLGGSASGSGSDTGTCTGVGSGWGSESPAGDGGSSGVVIGPHGEVIGPRGEELRDGYTITSAVTVHDLAHFPVRAGSGRMEPDGWSVVGLDTNFFARSGIQLQTGPLLGEEATVRFIPVRYHWDYGDGETVGLGVPGASWRALGVGRFEPTPTSHAYAAAGTYTVELMIEFAAEYRWAGRDWTGVVGTIPVPASPLTVTVGGAKTVLVEHDCTVNPTGPGC